MHLRFATAADAHVQIGGRDPKRISRCLQKNVGKDRDCTFFLNHSLNQDQLVQQQISFYGKFHEILPLADETAKEVIINKTLRFRDREVDYRPSFFLFLKTNRLHLS
jgi:hypothetical protein